MNEITQVLEEEIKLNKKETRANSIKLLNFKLNDYAIAYCKKHNLSEDL